MIGTAITIAGCVLGSVAFAMKPNGFIQPLSNVFKLSDEPRRKAFALMISMALVFGGSLVALLERWL